jgi:hypothetical protein
METGDEPPNNEQAELQQRLQRERELEAERIARDRELEEESIKLDQEIEQEIRGAPHSKLRAVCTECHVQSSQKRSAQAF